MTNAKPYRSFNLDENRLHSVGRFHQRKWLLANWWLLFVLQRLPLKKQHKYCHQTILPWKKNNVSSASSNYLSQLFSNKKKSRAKKCNPCVVRFSQTIKSLTKDSQTPNKRSWLAPNNGIVLQIPQNYIKSDQLKQIYLLDIAINSKLESNTNYLLALKLIKIVRILKQSDSNCLILFHLIGLSKINVFI